jgi:ribosome assembly protein SQT1
MKKTSLKVNRQIHYVIELPLIDVHYPSIEIDDDIIEDEDIDEEDDDNIVEESALRDPEANEGDHSDADIFSEALEPAIHTFQEHKEPVLVIAVSKSGTFAVTGGQDDIAHVFDINSGEKKFSCRDHKDSVTGVGINFDDTLIATADMNGTIQVWKFLSGEKVFDTEVDDIHWISWHPIAPFALLAGSESGSVWMFNVSDSTKIKTFQSGSSACTSGKVTKCGNKLMTGYEDGSLRFWDLKTGNIIHAIKGKSFSSSSQN